MKANEFRIGNWYNEFGIPKQVVPNLILKLYQIELAGKVVIDVSPIPLTPEILVKAGFRQNFNFFNIRHLEYTLISNRMRYKTKIIDKPLKYVHQLQNLYFTLTGEELNIEL